MRLAPACLGFALFMRLLSGAVGEPDRIVLPCLLLVCNTLEVDIASPVDADKLPSLTVDESRGVVEGGISS